jgi:hypothetical protein
MGRSVLKEELPSLAIGEVRTFFEGRIENWDKDEAEKNMRTAKSSVPRQHWQSMIRIQRANVTRARVRHSIGCGHSNVRMVRGIGQSVAGHRLKSMIITVHC